MIHDGRRGGTNTDPQIFCVIGTKQEEHYILIYEANSGLVFIINKTRL